jgi:transcriptional regulator with XRE-family HTH domain
MYGTRQNYDYVECGLSSVHLTNVLVYECECGSRVPEIPAITGLHFMIALDLLRKSSLLSGEEIKFLRKMAGLSQSEMAEIMGVTPTRPCKWEATSASKEGDRLLRTIFLLGMIQHIAKGKDPARMKSLATENFIRELDVRELLKSIDDKLEGPKAVKVENDPAAVGDDVWFLPDLGRTNRQPLQ